MSDKKIVYCYRYMWQIEGSDTVNFKIVTDIKEGLVSFEENLKALSGIKNLAREYLHEYDCSLIGLFEPLLVNKEVNNA